MFWRDDECEGEGGFPFKGEEEILEGLREVQECLGSFSSLTELDVD